MTVQGDKLQIGAIGYKRSAGYAFGLPAYSYKLISSGAPWFLLVSPPTQAYHAKKQLVKRYFL